MANIVYILKRIKEMDKKAMLNKIQSIHKKTGKSRFSIFMDMRKCAVKYGAGYMDYDLFEMYNLSDEQRDTYLTRGRNNELVLKHCDMDYLHYFVNKDEFNTKFSKYIKRDWIKFSGTDKQKIIDFMKNHKTFMVKPIKGSCGKGIEKINVEEYNSVEEIYENILNSNNEVELEEVIVQHDALNKIYPYAINTLRVVTITTTADNKPILSIPKEQRENIKLKSHIICTYFRIGKGKKYVDNFNSEGMVVPVDEKTGIVNNVAIDKNKNIYEVHPDTGEKIKGFQFPYWEETLQMCMEAAKEIPEMGYVGWDVGFTNDGPLFVEGNEFPGHDIYQLPEHTPEKIGIISKFKLETI